MNRPKMPKKPSLALDTNIVQDNMPQMVIPGIFIGSIHAAFNQEALLEIGVTHILNASRVPATFPKHFTYLSIDIRDREDANILSCIPATNIFLEAGIDAGGVLIHCFGGRSRSAAFVAAFLMSSRGWSLDRAMEVVTAARPVAAINGGFDRQLRAYMETHYDVYASQQVLLRNRILSLRAVRGNLPSPRGGKKKETFAGEGAALMPTIAGGAGAQGTQAVGSPRAVESGQKKRWRDPNEAVTKGRDGNMVIDSGREVHENCEAEDAAAAAAAAAAAGGQGPSNNIQEKKAEVPAVPVLEGSAPNCRLSRPGSTTVRVIPPLRGLERRYGCVGCGRSLFSLANVVREDGRGDIGQDASSNDSVLSVGSGAGRDSARDREPVAAQAKPGRPASATSTHSEDSPAAQFKVPLSSPKHSFNLSSAGSGSGSGSGPMTIPAAPKSSRHGERRSFSFGDDFGADSKGGPGSTGGSTSTGRGSVSSCGSGDGSALGDDSMDMDFSQSPQQDCKLGRDTIVPALPMRSLNLPPGKVVRPQSAEKRRWLARVSLLKADSKESIHTHPDVPDAKSAKLAADDQGMVDVVEKGKQPYFTVEYLGWMGMEPLGTKCDEGKLECPGCARAIGTWSWKPDSSSCEVGTPLIPLFRALRSSVQLADLPLDATPMSTPRLADPSPRDSMGEDGSNMDTAENAAGGASNLLHK